MGFTSNAANMCGSGRNKGLCSTGVTVRVLDQSRIPGVKVWLALEKVQIGLLLDFGAIRVSRRDVRDSGVH